MDCSTAKLLQLHLLEHGGVAKASCIGKIYLKGPQHKMTVQAAGGIRGFCSLHAHLFSFDPSVAGGEIRLVDTPEPAVEKTVPCEERQLKGASSNALQILSKLVADGSFDGVGLGSFKPAAERQLGTALDIVALKS